MKKILFIILIALSVLTLCGCEKQYTKSDIEDAKRQAYNEGYNDGYYHGVEDQKERDYEDFLIDGRSINDIEELVYKEYGITPAQAFSIMDEYEYDQTHGGFTWAEYQHAIEAMYYTASLFPLE